MEGSIYWLPQLDQTEDRNDAIPGILREKLKLRGFLSYLARDDRFRSVTTVYVPCGKADKLYYSDVKALCPAMTKLIHRTWLMMNGNLEYVLQGQGRHPCYWVYKHDKEYIQGETAWIKYSSCDGKYEKVQEEQLVQLEQLVPQRGQTKPTNFYRGLCLVCVCLKFFAVIHLTGSLTYLSILYVSTIVLLILYGRHVSRHVGQRHISRY